MSFLNVFKKFQEKLKISNNCGISTPASISNEEYQLNRQAEVTGLEKKYDLSTIDGINAIPVPSHKQQSSSTLPNVTGSIEYYLMHKAGNYEKAGEVELALACFRKANELMPLSATAYGYDVYMRLPRYLRKLRRFDEARIEECNVSKLFPDGGVFSLSKAEFIRDMRNAGHSSTRADVLYKEYVAERNKERQKAIFRLDYDWLWEFLPDICPKSFSGYMRMRNANSESFHRIVAEAAKLGKALS